MRAAHVWYLVWKELRCLWRDPVMMCLIVYSFSVSIYAAATAMPGAVTKATIAFVDQDHSALSHRLMDAFYPPLFLPPVTIEWPEMDRRMDLGVDTFAVVIPSHFERDILAGRHTSVQLNVDATRLSQAVSGTGYAQAILSGEVQNFMRRPYDLPGPEVNLALRLRFNPAGEKTGFGALMELVNSITMLAIVLTGAALIREREHGTVEHLLVMPLTPLEIVLSKVLAMGGVVWVCAALSLRWVVLEWLNVPIEGSLGLFLSGTALHLFAATSMGVFLATIARSMPQIGVLLLLVLLPLEILSGGMTPRESMPKWVQWMMLAAPTTHDVALSQAILFRGAGLSVVWPHLLALALIGSVLFALSLARFRQTMQ
ncbi:MAG: ABC transporter permease [Burkholderiales bacterium]